MLWFLLIFLFAIAILAYKITKDYFSPSFLLSIVFIISCTFSIIGNLNWKCDINGISILVISAVIFMIFIGELFARFVIFRKNFEVERIHIKSIKTIRANKIVIILFIIIQILFTIVYYRRMIEIAVNNGYSGENYFMYARNSTESAGFLYNFVVSSFEPFALICMFIFINNFISNLKFSFFIKNFIFIIPTVIFCFTTVLTGARVGIVEYVIIFVLMLVYFIRKININGYKIKYRYIFIPVATILFALIFAFLKIGESRNGLSSSNYSEYINVYSGSSIVAFSEWFPNRTIGSNSMLGSFKGIFNTLSRLNTGYERTFYDFVTFKNGTSTNVYTGFRAYIEDFGIFGLLVISFLIGTLITCFYKKIIDSKNMFFIILYLYFLKHFVYLFLASSITSELFSPTQILYVFWLFILCYFIRIFSKFHIVIDDRSNNMLIEKKQL